MKKTNKGFSLVELIIVIAIMAILAGAIAPALIRYIDKSRKSNDVTSAKAIKTAVETALGNEQMYEYLTSATPGAGDFTGVLVIEPGVKLTTSTTGTDNSKNCVTVYTSEDWSGELGEDADLAAAVEAAIQKEVATNIGEKMPKCKYKKNASKPKDKAAANKPECFVATVSAGGEISVYVCTNGTKPADISYKPVLGKDDDLKSNNDLGTDFQLVPEVSSYYQ
ncbi:MAG: type II secretion system protein [Lachnospiraceae bacterium]|nr:type II secretion system protein [Lachnospiraceae bacterium]